MSVAEFAQLFEKHPFKQSRLSVESRRMDDNSVGLTVFSGKKKLYNIVGHATVSSDALFRSGDVERFEKRCLAEYGARFAAVCSLSDPRGFAVLPAAAAETTGAGSQRVLEWRVYGPNPYPVPLWGLHFYDNNLPRAAPSAIDDIHKPWSIDPGPGMGYIVRAESRVSDVSKSDVHAETFTAPSEYKRVSLASFWKNQN